MARPALIDLNPNEYNQGLRYYPFEVNLDICNESCNIFDNSSSRMCDPSNRKRKYKCF